MQKKLVKHNFEYAIFFVVVFIMGVINIYGTQSTFLSLISTILQYSIVFYFLFKGDYGKTLLYLLAFTGILIDSDHFIYGGTTANHIRYSFIQVPLFIGYLRYLIIFIVYYQSINEYRKKRYILPETIKLLKKWFRVLLYTGVFSILIGILLDDNGIMDYPGAYPKQAILYIISYLARYCMILSVVYLCCREGWKDKFAIYLQLLIIIIALVSVLAALIGYGGVYGDYSIMMSSISIGLTPLLILFVYNKNPYKFWSIIAAVSVVICSFIYSGTVVGSKWYVIIGLAIIGLLIMIFKLEQSWKIGIVSLGILFLVPTIIEPVLSKVSGNDYTSIKFEQALGVMNVIGASNMGDWYYEMDASPLQRFDEIHNTFIEYTNKPWFALFGKGIGGTTRHYTNLLSWSGESDYTEDQIKMGAFYRLHESLAVIFLQHGIAGVIFFFMVIVMLIKRLYKSPWGMIALIWFFFYWDYGTSISIGSVALVLCLMEYDNNNDSLKVKE